MLECLKSYLKKGWGSSLYSDMKEKIEKDFQIKKKSKVQNIFWVKMELWEVYM